MAGKVWSVHGRSVRLHDSGVHGTASDPHEFQVGLGVLHPGVFFVGIEFLVLAIDERRD